MSRLQELAALAAAQQQAQLRAQAPWAIRRWRDVLEAARPHAFARQLAESFSAERLQADLAGVDPAWWGRHLGPYHDGAWESISLWAPRGDLREQRSLGGAFGPTQALKACPYVAEVLARFPGEKNRVRFMRLRAGGHILRHSDPLHQIDPKLIRVHVPVVTSPAVRFLVNDRRVVMQPGEVWHVDVRFPHEVHNEGDVDRVHLVIDLVANAELRARLAKARSLGRGFLTGYYVRHSLPAWARERWKIGN
jgi:quercetin dioxygenase-like cupin family protein